MILAIDPGKDKCGLAIFDEAKKLLQKEIVTRQQIKAKIAALKPTIILVGQSAAGKKLAEELKPDQPDLFFVDEKNSTLEARKLYWQENPPRGLWKLIPTSLRIPPEPIDDYAAVILGKRHFNK